MYITLKSGSSHFHQPLFPLYLCFPFPCLCVSFSPLHQRLDVVTPRRLSFSLLHSSLHSIFLPCKDVIHCQHCQSPEFSVSLCKHPPPTLQDFPLLRLDDIVDEQSNIVGFSMFNTTHPFYLEFIRSLNLSWREGCDLTYPGPAVSVFGLHVLMHAHY